MGNGDSSGAERGSSSSEGGGIPLSAQRRMRQMGQGDGPFTSDLSVADFALCHRYGLRPLSQVMGTSVYQIGYQPVGYGFMGEMIEMRTLSEAWNEARDRAFARLGEEAACVGASAVVGVDVRSTVGDLGETGGYGSIEYVVTGTAVARDTGVTLGRRQGAADHSQRSASAGSHSGRSRRQDRADPAPARAPAPALAPVLTELTVADYAKLLAAGVEPIGIVAWTSIFFVSLTYIRSAQPMFSGGAFQNFEYVEVTEAFYSARERVTSELGRQAQALGASGIVGVRIGHTTKSQTIGGGPGGERTGLMVSFSAIGTAVHDETTRAPEPPVVALDIGPGAG